MPDEFIPRPRPTPPPRSKEELEDTVASIADKTEMLVTVLPRAVAAAEEARDEVIILGQRVNRIEAQIPHACVETERQDEQDEKLEALDRKDFEHAGLLQSISKFKNGLIGAIGAIVLIAGGFAVATRVSEATNATNISRNRSDIDRHEVLIRELPRKEDMDRLEKAVSNVPSGVVRFMTETESERQPTPDSVEDAVQDIDGISEAELNQIKRVLNKIRVRKNGDTINGSHE